MHCSPIQWLLLWVALALVASGPPSPPEPAPYEPPRPSESPPHDEPPSASAVVVEVHSEIDDSQVAWRRLVLRASKLFARITLEIRLAAVPATEAVVSLVPSPHGMALSPGDSEVLLATVDIESVSGFSRKKWLGNGWFRPADGSALQRVRFKPGEDGTKKIYRYSSDGVFRIVSEPNSSREAKLPPAEWTKSSERFFPFRGKSADCAKISDPFVLLYVLSSTPLSSGDRSRVCVFNKKALYFATLEVAGSERVAVDYSWESAGRETRINHKIATLKVQLTARAVDPQVEAREPFEFLGLEGEIEILVDPTSRLPVAIRGNLPSVGRLDFELSEATAARQGAVGTR